MNLLPSIRWSPEMVTELAYGMEDPVDIALRYGITASQFKDLEAHKPFLAEVAAKRAELERGGHTVKVKAAWMAENLLDDMYLRAKSPDASINQVQESIKILAKLADLEPKGAQQVAPGPGFSVVINIPQLQTDDGKTIEAVTKELKFPVFTPKTEEKEGENE